MTDNQSGGGGAPRSGRRRVEETLIVGWTGMRGILMLAAPAAVPETTSSGAPFPRRDAIQAIASAMDIPAPLSQIRRRLPELDQRGITCISSM
jgi:hypothetical protein